MLIELPGGKKIDSEDPIFKRLTEEQQRELISKQEKLIERRRAKAVASQKCRALKKGLPWPPQQAEG